MADEVVTGWDLGGAHLKAAQVERGGRLVTALQVPCRLWLGMEELAQSLRTARQQLRRSRRHGVTMTGELADLFADRAEGVARLSRTMAETLAGDELRLYAGSLGFVATPGDHWQAVASANWHASARFVARRCPDALFIDIGSTTTDIVPLRNGEVKAVGYTDDERLVSEELVYTGATRTPVMAVATSVPFGGQRQRLMAEHFATMADVHRLTGELPADADQLPTADGRGRTAEESADAQALGRSRGGYGPKGHVLADAGGRAIGFVLTPGQGAERPQAGKLLEFLPGTPVWTVADRGYSAHDLRMAIRDLGSKPAIPTRRNEAKVACPDWIYVNRERVERLWGRLKEWRAVATRYEKTAGSYIGILNLAAVFDWI